MDHKEVYCSGVDQLRRVGSSVREGIANKLVDCVTRRADEVSSDKPILGMHVAELIAKDVEKFIEEWGR